MCGIAALFAPAPRAVGNLIGAMTELVRHRGPDGEGFAIFGGEPLVAEALAGSDTPSSVFGTRYRYAPTRLLSADDQANCIAALGHRRLSIVDLSPAGHQPMTTADGRYWIVYNGEIYNHVELRAELESLGCALVSQSDTEVILHAYAKWGERCLGRFNGMFAFVLLDRVGKRVLIARDRFGVKPLYLWRAPDGLVAVASEIKQFSVLPGWAPRLNGQRAYEFLNWGLLDHAAETLFADVRQLRGGEFIHCDLAVLARDLPVQRWYALVPRPFAGNLDDAAVEFRLLFTDAVRLRLRADVPVGSCLSGGLDSSSIVCVANRLLRSQGAEARQRTFSACATVKRYDERDYVDEVIAKTGAQAHYVYPDLSELFDSLDAITWHQDEPFGSTSIYAQWHVFKLAREAQVKVLLDGQGADELLAGYHGFFAPHFAALFTSLRWARLWREMREAERLHAIGLMESFKYLGNALLPEPIRQPLRKLVGKSAAAPEWIERTALAFDDRDPYIDHGFKTTSVNRLAYSMLARTSVPMLLHWEDRDSMAHSVESRLPFLDFRLVEFVMGLPEHFKLAGATTKQVLRHSMKAVLPERIRTRMDKMGFVTPEEVWIRHHAPDRFRAELRRAIDASRGVIRPRAMKQLDAVIDERKNFNPLLWRVISFGRWMNLYKIAL
jgi:asparagine synthase (glutamine-hydrolysing)